MQEPAARCWPTVNSKPARALLGGLENDESHADGIGRDIARRVAREEHLIDQGRIDRSDAAMVIIALSGALEVAA
ncbi:MAG TPA: hypothetical protein VHV78_02615, partial [Gemmatimonadaceae bacterium]|nr:hypothetical protein [Gemmatimonadaceae bacterium]